jgi:hypothetical protein
MKSFKRTKECHWAQVGIKSQMLHTTGCNCFVSLSITVNNFKSTKKAFAIRILSSVVRISKQGNLNVQDRQFYESRNC